MQVSNDSDGSKLLRIKEAASIIGVSDQTLRAWVKQGYMKCLRLPSGERRFEMDEIRRVVEELRVNAERKEPSRP